VNSFIDKIYRWFKTERLPVVTEKSTLEEIAQHYPSFWLWLEKRYRIHKTLIPTHSTLAGLSQKFDLPPPQVLFMEIQLDERENSIQEITALEAKALMEKDPSLTVLDVRESWERSFGSLPHSQVLDQDLLNQIKENGSKDKSILLYCHFGVRSKDAAHFLSSEGFFQVMVLRGGIDAWSTQVDPSLPRYTGSYC
jgi:rhodanese-related sulfurtransferase